MRLLAIFSKYYRKWRRVFLGSKQPDFSDLSDLIRLKPAPLSKKNKGPNPFLSESMFKKHIQKPKFITPLQKFIRFFHTKVTLKISKAVVRFSRPLRDTLKRLPLFNKWTALAILLVIFIALEVLFIRLALWQHSRWQEKIALRTEIIAAQEGAAASAVHLDARNTWHKVLLEGEFLNESTKYYENQRLGLNIGRRVLTPMRLTDGRDVLIDRGWLARPQNGKWPDLKHFHTPHQVRLEGVVRRVNPPEGWLGSPLYGADETVMLRLETTPFEHGQPLLNVYAQSLTPTHPDLTAAPDPLPAPTRHLNYKLTWAGLALLLPLMMICWCMGTFRPQLNQLRAQALTRTKRFIKGLRS